MRPRRYEAEGDEPAPSPPCSYGSVRAVLSLPFAPFRLLRASAARLPFALGGGAAVALREMVFPKNGRGRRRRGAE